MAAGSTTTTASNSSPFTAGAATRVMGWVMPSRSSKPTSPRPWAAVACFAGLGPGEVEAGGRKVVGVAQWRCRQGALFQTCAYRHWEAGPLLDLLGPRAVPPAERSAFAEYLGASVAGTSEVAGPAFGPRTALGHLPPGPDWELTADPVT